MTITGRAAVSLLALANALAIGQARADDYYPKRQWGKLSGGEMHTSSFVFRDLNRNGIYDLGDRPMKSVVVKLTKSDGRWKTERTNINGFANFDMSLAKRDRDVVDPGRYDFLVIPPPGWSVSTGNAEQNAEYETLPGAPGDMISLKTSHPVGLVQDLTISGKAPAGAVVSLTAPDGTTNTVDVGKNGDFSATASEGEWQVAVALADGASAGQRKVTVGAVPVVLSAFTSDFIGPEPDALPERGVVGFDDLQHTATVQEVPSGYGGLRWYNIVAMHEFFAGGPGYINTAMSGEFIAYNSSGHPAQVWNDKPFDFEGAYFGVGWDDAEGETLILKGWRGDNQVYEDRVTLSAMGPVHVAADYRSITRLQISTEHYWQAAIDDFTYRLAP